MLRNSRNGDFNNLHYSSMKSKRVCQSVLAAELFSMVYGFDSGYVIKDSLHSMIKREGTLSVYTDSHTLYELCISLSNTTKRQLLIDLTLLREAYEQRETTNLYWILTKLNRRCSALEQLLRTTSPIPSLRRWRPRCRSCDNYKCESLVVRTRCILSEE